MKQGPRLRNGYYYGRNRNRAPLKSLTTKKALMKPSIIDTEKIARRVVTRAINKNIETKHKDGALTAYPDWTGEVYNMLYDPSGSAYVTQGVGVAQYIGEQVKVSSIRLRFNVAVADSYNMIRVVVIQAKGVFVPTTMADILQSVSNIRAPLTALDLDYDNRFTLLYDSGVFDLSTYVPTKTRDVYISGKYIRKTSFSDASGTPEDGGIYIGIISDSGVTTHPSFLAYWRVNYKDA